MLVWLLTDADTTMSPRLFDDKNLTRGRRKNELQSLSDAQTRDVNLQSILLMPIAVNYLKLLLKLLHYSKF